MLSDSITECVSLEGALAGFDLEIRRLLGHCKEIPFLNSCQSL